MLALGLKPKKTESRPKKQHTSRSDVARGKKKNAEISLDQAYRIRGQDDRRQKEQAVARKLESERQRRQINQKIKAVIKDHAIRDAAADTKRNFLYKGRIRSVLATREQISKINDGSLGVVYLSGNYHLLPADQIEDIRQFSPDHIPDLKGAESEDETENPVPDDLIW